jgi:3D (Asp-Asp-Asp) domain-containing protein
MALSVSLSLPSSAAFAQCVTRSMRITFYTCAESLPQCLTKSGNQPIPFRTVAVGDRRLLGQWLYIEDLGGWVHASDTGAALKPNAIDVFIGEARMVPSARRLGVQHWSVRVCDTEHSPGVAVVRGASAGMAVGPGAVDKSLTEAAQSRAQREGGEPAHPDRERP